MTLMPPSGTLLLTILVLCCWATGYIPSSVAALACLSSFYSLLLMLIDAPFAKRLLAWAVQLYQIRPRIVRLDAAYWGLCLIAWIHAVLGAVAVIPWNPNVRRIAPVYLLPGPKKNSGNVVASSASLDAFFSFFTSNAHPYVAGPRLPHRLP